MPEAPSPHWIEEQVENWRGYLRRHRGDPTVDAKLEAQLRSEIADLARAGLAGDEAFWIAAKRLGARDPVAAAFARDHSGRFWKQLAVVPADSGERSAWARRDAFVAFAFAILAAVAIKAPALFGLSTREHEEFYVRNASLFVLPCLTAYFVWKRHLAPRVVAWLAGGFVIAGFAANLAMFGGAPGFVALTATHLPIALLLAVGIAYAGGRWNEVAARMDFIRFSGELFIYYVLIALGGGVLCAFIAMMFHSIGIDIEPFFESWLLPCGAAGAVVVASWLVEAKQSVIENMAPVLTRLFTPLFAAMLLAFLAALAWSDRGIAIERDLLIGFDLLLVVVLGLLLYSISARDPNAPPGVFDGLQILLLVSALAADAVALWAIGARIGEFGLSPNRVAALGENILLLLHLAGSAVLYLRFVFRRGPLRNLERWQTGYLPVYVLWAALVVVVFPLVFRGA
jgi:hypothetical protein